MEEVVVEVEVGLAEPEEVMIYEVTNGTNDVSDYLSQNSNGCSHSANKCHA